MTIAPYDQAKFADHEDSNLDSYSTVKGCPFFELAIGTSWRTFCFSTCAGSKDQLVATRESQFSEPTMTYQTHSNSLLYANHCISMPYILHGTSKCAFMTTSQSNQCQRTALSPWANFSPQRELLQFWQLLPGHISKATFHDTLRS